MKIKSVFSLIALFIFSITLSAQDNYMNYWPQWRGPLGTGAAVKGNPPIEFSETQNLKWKTEIPGKGNATPIVWGDKIIVQSAVPTDQKGNKDDSESGNPMSPVSTEFIHDFKVFCIDRNSGKIDWETTVTSELPLENTHDLSSWASNSPCTDGEHIYAYFGSRGLYSLDFEGNVLWKRDFGQMQKRASFGEGASPFLYKDRLFILWDHEGDSWLFCIDKNTGEELWKVARDEGTSWSTPIVAEVNGKPQVITAATKAIRSYDIETGDLIWSGTGLTGNVIPNPMVENGILYAMSGFRGSALQAINLSKAKGDITGTEAVTWEYNQDTPYTPGAVLMDGKLYFLRANNGFLSCLNARDGSVVYSKQKVEGISTLFSSPTGAADRLYIAAENVCVVIKAGETYELLKSNILNDNFHASPVIVDDQLILRGFNALYCFEE
ncbi:PQQ-binding-like beta-propeller repeat protein [Maribellus sediminis]|uniref:outer membrane protein assembly factor BamB family protein n=1 Tax=Maribellus sediminis TaxID=2696285 RepID=UPI0014319E51|nr:PQQ-binding-like beta-propeller repeat protein [Maribellus sediminis]